MLRANNSRLSVTPAKLRSGVTTIAGGGLMVAYNNQNLPGASRSRFGSLALEAPFGSMPEGYVHPYAWILPQKAGSLKVSPAAEAVFTPSANLNIGRPLASAVTVDFTTSANLDMVVAFSGDITVAFTTAGSLDGIVNLSADTTAAFSVDASLDMLVSIAGAITVTFSPSANQTGITSLEGSVSPFTELSPENLARAVWNAQVTNHLESGSTGAALNAAGSAGDPWSTPLPGSYTGSQAGAILTGIKTKTDSLTFTVSGKVDSNTTYVNSVAVSGTGAEGSEWGPA